jgi:hypothetical protein
VPCGVAERTIYGREVFVVAVARTLRPAAISGGGLHAAGFRARLYPIHSIGMRLERTNVLDRTIWPLGFDEPLVFVAKHNTEQWCFHNHDVSTQGLRSA